VDLFGKKGMGSQDGDNPIEQTFQRASHDELDVKSDRIGAIGTANRRGVGFIMGLLGIVAGLLDRCFVSPGAGALTNLPSIETHQSHEGLRGKDDRINMPEKAEAGDDTHEIDQDHGREFHVAGSLPLARIKTHEKLHYSQLFKKVEELVKKPGFSKAINLGDLLAFGKVFRDPSLVSSCSAPRQSFSNLLRRLSDQFHGKTSC